MKQVSPIETARFNFGIAILTTGTAATDTFSGAIDTMGYEYALVLIGTGTVGADTTTIKLYDCATSGGTYAAITGASTTVVNADDNIVKWGVVRLHGKNRYIKVVHNSATGGVTSNIQAHVILANAKDTAFFNATKSNSAAAGSESHQAVAFNVA